MLLSNLIDPISKKTIVGSSNPDICAIAYDSRQVVPGAIFVCIRGENYDGHNYIDSAMRNGARAVMVCDGFLTKPVHLDIPIISVHDTREALPIIANHFYDYPSRKLKLIGVTGTKGKTTITFLMNSILQQNGMETGIIGTMGTRIKDRVIKSNRTTPESVDLQCLLAEMNIEGVSAVSMEVSSHALVKQRTVGCEFDVGIYTNLTHEHLDFHKSLDEYFKAKMLLFTKYPQESSKPFTAIVNNDDPRGNEVSALAKGSVITYGIKNQADIMAEDISCGANGTSFHVKSRLVDFNVELKLGGMFNVYNTLAAIGAAIALNIDPDIIKRGLESVQTVDGRFESINCGQDFNLIVDYAHTPDSLENVLISAREITDNRVIVVFGCGGNRDRTKRPMMGQIASQLADISIITSDNPRREDPNAIIDEIMAGIDEKSGRLVERILDRHDAIERAIRLAQPGDTIVIAGKGHEDYQEFADRTAHFDDREVARELLSASSAIKR